MRNDYWRFFFGNPVTKIVVSILLVFLVGCSNENEAENNSGTPSDGNPKNVGSGSTKEPPQNGSIKNAGNSEIRVDGDGQKWWKNHPYDIWFEDPLKVAANQTSIAKNSSNPKAKTAGKNTKKTPEPKKVMDSAGTLWVAILPVETISTEIKNIRNSLTATMKTVGKYNSNFREIPAHATTISVLAMILEKHPGSVTWKEDARYVRDLGMKIEEAADGRGRKSFDATLKPFEQLIDILDHNKPSGLNDPEKEIEVADYASMGSVMKRIDKSYRYLKSDANDPDTFKKTSGKVKHEARLMAALIKFLSDESYGYADAKPFLDHVNGMIDDSLEIVEAGNSENFSMFRTAIDRISNRCTQCHTTYR